MNQFLRIMFVSTLLLSTLNFCTGSTEIRGRVVDKDTGRPIFGAAVKVESEGRIAVETRTDRDGVFHLTQNALGQLWISVSLIGYADYSEMLETQARFNRNINYIVGEPSFPARTRGNYRQSLGGEQETHRHRYLVGTGEC